MLINKIKLNINDIDGSVIKIPLSSNFSTETQQYENIEENFNLSGSDIINTIVDYEKIKLLPVGSVSFDILTEENDSFITEELEFLVDEDYNPLSIGETTKTDGLNFNLHFRNGSSWDTEVTKLNAIGFTEDDVKKKKKKIKNTFLRLSFFDSKDLKTQNLLYYSTIYLDIDELYSNYISSGNNMETLLVNFKTENPKLSKKIKSFEGFGLYLFKNDIPKDEINTIYMRVDFNNAENGRSTLFLKDKPTDVNGYDMKGLYDNLFFEIEYFYNNNNK